MKKLEISAQTARWLDETDHRGSIKFIKECGFEALDFNINSFLDVFISTIYLDCTVKYIIKTMNR